MSYKRLALKKLVADAHITSPEVYLVNKYLKSCSSIDKRLEELSCSCNI